MDKRFSEIMDIGDVQLLGPGEDGVTRAQAKIGYRCPNCGAVHMTAQDYEVGPQDAPDDEPAKSLFEQFIDSAMEVVGLDEGSRASNSWGGVTYDIEIKPGPRSERPPAPPAPARQRAFEAEMAGKIFTLCDSNAHGVCCSKCR